MNRSLHAPLELGDVVRRFGPAFMRAQDHRLLPSQRKALADIAACHTAARGGHRYRCGDCGRSFWVYHGCGNRSCPSCHTQATRQWIGQCQTQLLGCRYFHMVVTVPESLRAPFLAQQKRLYGLLMTTAASCVMELARDPKFLGATPAILAVLHTWKGDMGFHPHVHLLVSAGGVSEDGRQWIAPPNPKWLLPVRAVSKLMRKRFRARLQKSAPDIFQTIEPVTWKTGWNSFCKAYGQGTQPVLNYLARYLHRVAISNARLITMDETHVTFRSKDSQTNRWRVLRLRGEEFLRRFVMHVLPRGFHKVRYYGLWHHSQRETRRRIRCLLAPKVSCAPLAPLLPDPSLPGEAESQTPLGRRDPEPTPAPPPCPHCKSQNVRLIESLTRNRSP